MRCFRSGPTSKLSLFCLPTLLALPLSAQQPPPPTTTTTPPFAETIEVREVEVRVDLSNLPPLESIGRKGREDFIVVEDGVSYPLTELGPKAQSPWIFLLYFDSTLASPGTRASAAIALARKAELLTAGGLAELVIADPRPHTVLSTGSAEALRHALDELAVAAGREPSRSEPSAPAATTARTAQLDRLAIEVAARGGSGARALLLPADGWQMSPETLAQLTRSGEKAIAERPELRPLLETARVLAGYGWVTLPVALREAREDFPVSAAERRMEVKTGGAGDRQTTVPVISIPAHDPHPDATTETQLDVVSDFALLPLAELSRATSGALIGQTQRLDDALGQLVHRRQFTYRSPFPAPGRLLPLEVRWKGGDGRLLHAPRWLRSSTPPEVAAARLRRLFAGDAAPPGTGIRLDLATNGICFAGDGDKHWVRLSTATARDGEIQIATGKPFQLEHGPNGFCTSPPANLGPHTALLAEDLETESWTGVLETAN